MVVDRVNAMLELIFRKPATSISGPVPYSFSKVVKLARNVGFPGIENIVRIILCNFGVTVPRITQTFTECSRTLIEPVIVYFQGLNIN